MAGSVSDMAAMKTSSPLKTPGSRATSCAVTCTEAGMRACEVRSPQGASSSSAMRTRRLMASRPGLISMRWRRLLRDCLGVNQGVLEAGGGLGKVFAEVSAARFPASEGCGNHYPGEGEQIGSFKILDRGAARAATVQLRCGRPRDRQHCVRCQLRSTSGFGVPDGRRARHGARRAVVARGSASRRSSLMKALNVQLAWAIIFLEQELRAAPGEDQAFEQGVGGEAVGSVDPGAGDFADREKARD